MIFLFVWVLQHQRGGGRIRILDPGSGSPGDLSFYSVLYLPFCFVPFSHLFLEFISGDPLQGLELDLGVGKSGGEGLGRGDGGSEGGCDLATEGGLHVAGGTNWVCGPVGDDAKIGAVQATDGCSRWGCHGDGVRVKDG